MAEAAITRTALVQLLKDNGPMTVDELVDMIQMNRDTVESSIYYARRKYGTKYFRVVEWVPYRGKGGMPAPVFGPGSDDPKVKDVPKPKFKPSERKRRYHEKYKALINLKKRIKNGNNPHFQSAA